MRCIDKTNILNLLTKLIEMFYSECIKILINLFKFMFNQTIIHTNIYSWLLVWSLLFGIA